MCSMCCGTSPCCRSTSRRRWCRTSTWPCGAGSGRHTNRASWTACSARGRGRRVPAAAAADGGHLPVPRRVGGVAGAGAARAVAGAARGVGGRQRRLPGRDPRPAGRRWATAGRRAAQHLCGALALIGVEQRPQPRPAARPDGRAGRGRGGEARRAPAALGSRREGVCRECCGAARRGAGTAGGSTAGRARGRAEQARHRPR
jgi:hypothetical protein